MKAKEKEEVIKPEEEVSTVEKTEKVEKKNKVDDKLDLILAEMAELRKKDSEKDEQIKMLMEIADNARKDNWDKKNKKPGVSVVKLTVHKGTGKIVKSWSSMIDEVFKGPDNKWVEKQVHKYILEDGEEVICSLTDKIRTFSFVPAEVKSKREELIDAENNIYTELYKVETKEGNEYEIDVKFVN